MTSIIKTKMFQGLKFESIQLPDTAKQLREEVRNFIAAEIDHHQLPDSDFNAGCPAEFSASLAARGWIGMSHSGDIRC